MQRKDIGQHVEQRNYANCLKSLRNILRIIWEKVQKSLGSIYSELHKNFGKSYCQAAFDTIDHYLTHSSIFLVWHSWHCTKLV